ncbi:hypothetical protein C8Q72DRAFT_861564 [Fomitopsis betulina]|nr:hypothetical protein C8Q72DRAFT_861564 [Fomitopsis betulina]
MQRTLCSRGCSRHGWNYTPRRVFRDRTHAQLRSASPRCVHPLQVPWVSRWADCKVPLPLASRMCTRAAIRNVDGQLPLLAAVLPRPLFNTTTHTEACVPTAAAHSLRPLSESHVGLNGCPDIHSLCVLHHSLGARVQSENHTVARHKISIHWQLQHRRVRTRGRDFPELCTYSQSGSCTWGIHRATTSLVHPRIPRELVERSHPQCQLIRRSLDHAGSSAPFRSTSCRLQCSVRSV